MESCYTVKTANNDWNVQIVGRQGVQRKGRRWINSIEICPRRRRVVETVRLPVFCAPKSKFQRDFVRSVEKR